MATPNKMHPIKGANPTRKINSEWFAFPSISVHHAFDAVQLSGYPLAIAGVTNAERIFLEVKNFERKP